jgi:beta-glucanase (GH16 family)
MPERIDVRSPRILLLLPSIAFLSLAGCTGEPDKSSDSASQRVSLEIGPAVAQPGERPSVSVDRMATAVAEPASPGTKVVLERRQSGEWRRIASDRQDEDGSALFEGMASGDGQGGKYRAVVTTPDGARVESEPASATWETVFRDEFSGEALDSTKWSHRQLGVYNSEGSRQCSKSDESAVVVSEGTLELQTRLDTERSGEACRTDEYGTHDYFLNGHISTAGKFDFTYGVAAARVRFQQERGMHGAFWLQRPGAEQVPGEPGVSGAEIDVAEFFGEGYQDGGLASFIYYLDSGGENKKVGGLWPDATRALRADDSWWDRYHVFSVEWSPDGYVFRVDGRETFRTSEGVSGVDQYLVLSMLSSDWELGKLDKSALPSSMDVDWVRVWERSPDRRQAG